MFNYPFRIPNNNIHQIVLHQPDRRQTDFERLEDIGADALAAARDAVAAIEKLPYEVFKPIQYQDRILKDAISRRQVLSEEFRATARDLLVLVHDADTAGDEPVATTLRCLDTHLRDALRLSYRVSDLLAAEKAIGWQRGISG